MNTINDYLAAAQQPNTGPAKGRGANDLGQPDFLKLMVAQLRKPRPDEANG